MAWTAPTAADLKARFPVFVAVDDVVVDGALAEAALQVDESWVSEADFRLGRMLYAAHVLTTDGLGTGPEAVAAAQGTLGISRMRSGTFEIQRATAASGTAASGELGTTSYGRRFSDLARLNHPAVLVV